ncbi:hypothetical protein OFM29_01750 [Neisseria gonorrhoeae]|uniref:hypothetical protein n=1 Tax=Neisseria gonorrhoeae TaxID=485 RepID=UPI0021E0CBFF|nr:hypothetical protein [Neisseria gonorrhoeae]MCU9854904.1 hypothetical protein [Neisseria gonorrhoeae]
MQNFIVWMNPDREESAAAAAKLNGAVLTAHTDGVMAAIRRELKRFGLGADLAVFAQTCEEFAKQANADMRYLMPAYRQYFNRPDKMVIFQGALQYLSDEDIAWIFRRHINAIIEWQSNEGLGLYEFGFSLSDVLTDGCRHVLREVVTGWLNREILPELYNV